MGGYPTHIAAVGGRETEDGTIYIYIYYTYVSTYIHIHRK